MIQLLVFCVLLSGARGIDVMVEVNTGNNNNRVHWLFVEQVCVPAHVNMSVSVYATANNYFDKQFFVFYNQTGWNALQGNLTCAEKLVWAENYDPYTGINGVPFQGQYEIQWYDGYDWEEYYTFEFGESKTLYFALIDCYEDFYQVTFSFEAAGNGDCSSGLTTADKAVVGSVVGVGGSLFLILIVFCAFRFYGRQHNEAIKLDNKHPEAASPANAAAAAADESPEGYAPPEGGTVAVGIPAEPPSDPAPPAAAAAASS